MSTMNPQTDSQPSEEPFDPKSSAPDSSQNEQRTVSQDRPAVSDFYTVGIGASAGGLEALEKFFEHMPLDTGMAFIVVQHLSPDFESHMDQLLGRITDIPIQRVTDGMTVQPDTIFLIPPKKEMIVSGGKLLLTDKDMGRGFSHPIDHFFRSLAQDAGRNSIGVILSGTGSDGSRGVVDIHESGGLVLCQSEITARFDGMPLSAQETGSVDLILPPNAMPEALQRYSKKNLARNAMVDQEIPNFEQEGLNTLFEALRGSHGIDFSHYKPSTIFRRITRRLHVKQIESLEEYVKQVQENPAELNALYCDLLIGVTRFFRDSAAFEALAENVIPELVKRAENGDPVRVWVAGCASGEEAYSLAILFHEEFEQRGVHPNFKVFATDVHQDSLEVASAGKYPKESLDNVDPEIVEKYFSLDNDTASVRGELRRSIAFARHNVITDAPFTKMDLVTCRNLLIYFQPIAQKKVLTLFHFGLKLGGFLFLGPSESTEHLATELVNVDPRWKIFRKRRDIRLNPSDSRWLGASAGSPVRQPAVYNENPRSKNPNSPSLLVPTYDYLLNQHMPPSFLIDSTFQLLHTFGGAERYLSLKGGRPSDGILELIRPELRTFLSGALQHARKESKPVNYSGVNVPTDDGTESLNVAVEPIQLQPHLDKQFLVTIRADHLTNTVERIAAAEVDITELTAEHISSLEVELRSAKENLQATIEELETSNEELQATNEELVASNEELQSTNEELQSVSWIRDRASNRQCRQCCSSRSRRRSWMLNLNWEAGLGWRLRNGSSSYWTARLSLTAISVREAVSNSQCRLTHFQNQCPMKQRLPTILLRQRQQTLPRR